MPIWMGIALYVCIQEFPDQESQGILQLLDNANVVPRCIRNAAGIKSYSMGDEVRRDKSLR